MSSYGTGRPATERDTLHSLNGTPRDYLGVIESSGPDVPASNRFTASPFCSSATPRDTLAGKTLMVQPTGAGYLLPTSEAPLVVYQQSLPVPFGSIPGVMVAANERVTVMMRPDTPFLQWVPLGGGANLFVWELT